MTFSQAGQTQIRFGMYRGQTIDEIASSNEGLMWLDWLLGEMETGIRDHPERAKQPSYEPVKTYLSDPSIAKEVSQAKADRDYARRQAR